MPPAVCLETAPPLLQHAGSGLSPAGLSPGVQATWNAASVCTAHPAPGQALAFAVTLLPPDLLRLGTLYLAMRLARAAARDGVFTVQAARLVLILGWVHLPASWGVSWPVVWFGLGLVIFARVMRISVGMRADLEGTV